MISDKIGTVELINADCMDILRTLPDNYYDLAAVDCPYGDASGGGTPRRYMGSEV